LYGWDALAHLAKHDRAKFLQLGFSILPRDVLVNIVEQRRPGGLSTEDWELMLRVLDAIKATVPAGANAPPRQKSSQ
jgi:hypothetical protein